MVSLLPPHYLWRPAKWSISVRLPGPHRREWRCSERGFLVHISLSWWVHKQTSQCWTMIRWSLLCQRTPPSGQWGTPTVSLAGVIGVTAGIVCSMAESVGDYHACARLSRAPRPPKHAINRGIGVEGLGSLLAGAFGTGNGTTSFSENVAALGITKVRYTKEARFFHDDSCFIRRTTCRVAFGWQVGSRTVILLSGALMILMGVLGKIGAIFTTIPTPVTGGMFLVMFGIITAAGISNLQVTDNIKSCLHYGFQLLFSWQWGVLL